MYTGTGGLAKKSNTTEGDSERDESTEEQLQCNYHYLCTSHGTLSPASLSYGHDRAPNPCFESMHETTETSNANMRYPKSLNPSPTVVRSRKYR